MPSPDPYAPPRRVGPYRIQGRLGVGGMGAVYRAYDDRLKRTVAIKHILPDIAGDEGSRQRLRREAQAAAGLSHPSIVQIFDIFENDGVDWIVMELVEGETLQALVDAGRLGLAEVVALSREVAEGLAEAHAKEIVHRDLKTENVMVTRSFHAKILDFGLAKSMGQGSDTGITDLGSILGTGRAMSPEQAMGEEVDHRSDLFSLGTLIFESVTGRSPFSGSSVYNTLARVCSVPHRPAWKINRQVPVELSNLIDRLLEKNPEHRPQSAREVVVELRVIEKMPLPEWGGPYAPWISSEDAESGEENLEFFDLDPAALPPAENPPMAITFGELARLQPRTSQGEPTLEVPAFDPPEKGADEAAATESPLLQRIDSSTVTAEVPTYQPPRREVDPQPGPRPVAEVAVDPGLSAEPVSGIRVRTVLALRVEGAVGDDPGSEAALATELRRWAVELDGIRLRESGSAELLLFDRPVHAVQLVLRISRWLEQMDLDTRFGLRGGIHLGEVTVASVSGAAVSGAAVAGAAMPVGEPSALVDGGPVSEIAPLAADPPDRASEIRSSGTSLLVASDLADMAEPGQALLTPEAYALCRRALRDMGGMHPEPRWYAHGRFYLDHLEEAVEIHAVSIERSLSALPPRDHVRGRLLPARGDLPSLPGKEDGLSSKGNLSGDEKGLKKSSGVLPPAG